MDPSTTRLATQSETLIHEDDPSHDKSHNTTNTKRRPVRRDLEKRRQQNIQAQKKYREKLKKRLDHLEAIAALVAVSHADPQLSTVPTSASNTAADATAAAPTTTTSPAQSLDHNTQILPVPALVDDYSSTASSVDFSDFDISNSISPAALTEVVQWDPTTSINPTHLLQHTDLTALTTCWNNSFIDCGCISPHVQVSGTKGPRQYREVRLPTPASSTNMYVADPYINSLRIERLCNIQAIWSNCLHIGITEDMFCDDDAISPFFRPSGSESTVMTIQAIFQVLNKDVRPIKEQITTPHHPVVDVLPFPTLRKNLLRSLDVIDEDDFTHDLINGLVFWGGTGMSRRDRNCATGRATSGTPWDGRSWEAKTWFLQKYWTLLGGADGELVRHSEWWRNIRGDEIDPCLGF